MILLKYLIDMQLVVVCILCNMTKTKLQPLQTYFKTHMEIGNFDGNFDAFMK